MNIISNKIQDLIAALQTLDPDAEHEIVEIKEKTRNRPQDKRVIQLITEDEYIP